LRERFRTEDPKPVAKLPEGQQAPIRKEPGIMPGT
jgi:hypothetical protein